MQWIQGEWGGKGYLSYDVAMSATGVLTESALEIVYLYSDGKTVYIRPKLFFALCSFVN